MKRRRHSIKIIRTQTMRVHYVVSNAYEGCGHRHNTMLAAVRCLLKIVERLAPDYAPYSVYRITYNRGQNQWRRTAEKVEGI